MHAIFHMPVLLPVPSSHGDGGCIVCSERHTYGTGHTSRSNFERQQFSVRHDGTS
jgi:hypothetical protein